MSHQYTDETLALIDQARRDIAAENAQARREAAMDTSAADQAQLAGIFAGIHAAAQAADTATAATDPEWAGPSLPHPSEATSPEEADELRQGWDDYHHGIEPNTEEAAL